MTDLLKNPIFQDETAAREWLEARVWANGRVCPHCGNADQEKLTKLEGKAHRPGVYQCNEPACRQQFTVTVNTVFERSKIPLTKWLAALFLMTASKKGVSAHQVHRMLGISYKSTWFMMHRLREAGWSVRHVPDSRVVHLEGASTGVSAETAQQPLPAYWYRSRRRYFALVGGRGGVLFANLGWLIGFTLARLKRLLGRPVGGDRMSDMLRHGFWPRAEDSLRSLPALEDPPGKPPEWMASR